MKIYKVLVFIAFCLTSICLYSSCTIFYTTEFVVNNRSDQAVSIAFETVLGETDTYTIDKNDKESFHLVSEKGGYVDLSHFDVLSITNDDGKMYNGEIFNVELWKDKKAGRFGKELILKIKDEDF